MTATNLGNETIAKFQREEPRTVIRTPWFARICRWLRRRRWNRNVTLAVQFAPIPGRDYEMACYQVTNAQYELFDPAHREKSDEYSSEDDCPVIRVSWFDARVFARWLGPQCRLPTEEEWEFACRAGSTGEYCFGDDEKLLGEYAWWDENSKGRTHPVGKLKPNAWGLFDVHGNVWEWCDTWFNGSSRVVRGGSWLYDAPDLFRCAYRCCNRPDARDRSSGFRVARTLTP